jgi:hypothetical protein
VDVGECFAIAPWLARDFGYETQGGAYLDTNGRYLDHCWTMAPCGTIIDTTHGQFDHRVPIMFAVPGTVEHARYLRAEDMTEEQRHRTFGDDAGWKPGEAGYTGPYAA